MKVITQQLERMHRRTDFKICGEACDQISCKETPVESPEQGEKRGRP